jgi:hypothetical protein
LERATKELINSVNMNKGFAATTKNKTDAFSTPAKKISLKKGRVQTAVVRGR